MSIERHPDPDGRGLSAADAVWPQRIRRLARASLKHWGHPGVVDVAELCLSELLTNALCHAAGPDIDVRVYARDGECVIEVQDGSPRRPELRRVDLDDENGRGLLLIDALASAWGVSDDGTTTWCTLPLTEGTSDMASPQIVREQIMEFGANPNSSGSARVWARSALTILAWPGPVHVAADVLYVLVTNAFEHGLPAGSGRSVRVALRLTEHDELLVDVEDHTPDFPAFDKAVSGELGRGLWGAKSHGAEVTWFPSSAGKTVRATLQAGPVDLWPSPRRPTPGR
ncbi:ATP-binding protein [Streptomyces zhihengii]|uniref:ATP-binding protein n=1 Tax=Streptomyces zhihengii TaxID=1818004 RepID=UPI0033A07979